MIYNNPIVMLQSIISFVKFNPGSEILSFDNPIKDIIVFCFAEDPKVCWEISVTDIKRYFRKSQGHKAFRIWVRSQKPFLSSTSRARLATSITSGVTPWENPHGPN